MGLAAPPSSELIQEVTRLRRLAHEKLTAAIAVIGDESHDRRAARARSTDRPSSR